MIGRLSGVSTPPAFPHRLAGHCGSGALRDLLELHELDYGHGPLSEGFAFGLGGGVGFLYVELPGAPTPAYLVGRTADLETDVAKSLAAISAGKSTRESLARIGDPDVGATLDRVASGLGSTEEGDVDRTTSYAVGSATSDGQRFRVLRPHASGGLGAVFVALDGELNREVALKQILDRHADDPVSRQRFLIEAEITGGLEHPGVVPVYGLGTYDGGRPYYAMRFIRGDSLKEAIERFHKDETLRTDPGRRSLELRKLLRRFTDICNAIDYAHSRGILHRDIRPDNVLISSRGEPCLSDLGLARILDVIEARTATVTLAHTAPEIVDGGRPSESADIYALGSMLFELLAGAPAFVGSADEPINAVISRISPCCCGRCRRARSPGSHCANSPPPAVASTISCASSRASTSFSEAIDGNVHYCAALCPP